MLEQYSLWPEFSILGKKLFQDSLNAEKLDLSAVSGIKTRLTKINI
jgi:hypothetical protein